MRQYLRCLYNLGAKALHYVASSVGISASDVKEAKLKCYNKRLIALAHEIDAQLQVEKKKPFPSRPEIIRLEAALGKARGAGYR